MGSASYSVGQFSFLGTIASLFSVELGGVATSFLADCTIEERGDIITNGDILPEKINAPQTQKLVSQFFCRKNDSD